ncbi:DUF1254 domain-containing protein [Ottowia sp.]|jgi:hypothetical protein|uniref:DUF1254 domain-containing protein n=1 Tax=Ottowia sp. TaxID=1898956 RepID=UPI0025E799D5|nr:DUF1254 domain-containing protein [Ottowia sp.]MBK6613881.1 DUF1254 domain-containing protein [Ottowia sp.]MBK6745556.1 DUF1254 domain-containing protein [Ottowia sp.]
MSTQPFLSQAFHSPQAAWMAHSAAPAVVAGYPLLESIRTCHVQTSPGASAYGRAPFNTFGHSRERWTDRDRDIVTPANDLLYSNAWLDLRQGPVVITVPPQTGRYFVLELMDAYTNNFHNIGTRNTAPGGERFALIGPGSDATVPEGTTPIHSPTALVWVLGRVLVDGDADEEAARGFQAGFRIDGPATPAPPPSVAQWQQGGDEVLDFFANLARALHDFPPPPSQRGVFDLLRGAHLRLSPDGKLGDLRPATLEGLRAAYATAMQTIEGMTRAASKAPWRYSTRLGRYGDDLMLRAATAWKGLGALAADEAIYAVTDYDDQGELLDGQRLYRLHFADGGQVPAGAFWSVTLYGEDRYLAPNPIGRYALGNRSPLQRNADGSLTLYVSQQPPPGPRENWLPAPAGGFYLILRLYHPQPAFLDGSYRMPPLEHVA